MKMLEKIYEQYIAGELDLAPASVLPAIRPRIEDLKKQCDMTSEQAEVLEELILDAAAQCGREMFFAGFRLAFEEP